MVCTVLMAALPFWFKKKEKNILLNYMNAVKLLLNSQHGTKTTHRLSLLIYLTLFTIILN